MTLVISCNEELLKQHCFFSTSVFSFQPYSYHLDSVLHLRMFCYDYDFAGGGLNNSGHLFLGANKKEVEQAALPETAATAARLEQFFGNADGLKADVAPQQRHHLSRCMWIFFSHCSWSQCSFTALELYSR